MLRDYERVMRRNPGTAAPASEALRQLAGLSRAEWEKERGPFTAKEKEDARRRVRAQFRIIGGQTFLVRSV